MTDFTLSQLTERYLRKLAPRVNHKLQVLPVYQAYESVCQILDPNQSVKNDELKNSMMPEMAFVTNWLPIMQNLV